MQCVSGCNTWTVKCDLCHVVRGGSVPCFSHDGKSPYRAGWASVEEARTIANEALEAESWLVLTDFGIDVCPSCRLQPPKFIAKAIADTVKARVLRVLVPENDHVLRPDDTEKNV